MLAPSAFGQANADNAPIDLSWEQGSLAVTVPDVPLEFGQTPPALVAAAAVLDSAFGDPAVAELSPIAGPTASADPSTPPSAASDPCAVPGADASVCPEGITARLLALEGDGDLMVYGAADPATGPDQGTLIWCEPTAVSDGALRLGAVTTADATVTITYWPIDNPSNVSSSEMTAVQTIGDGWVRYCGETAPLEPGRYEGTTIAISPDGIIASPWLLDFDSRGTPVEPTMRVVPLGTNWVWVGVYHTAGETALIDGYGLLADGTGSCEGASSPAFDALRVELAPHTTDIPREWLRLRNYNEAYSQVTSAVLYIPEGTSAGVCGQTYTSSEPSWEADVPERVQFSTVSAPDSWKAVVTVRELSVFQGGSVTLTAQGALGTWCGNTVTKYFDAPRSDAATTVPVNTELCSLSGQDISINVQTYYRSETGISGNAESSKRFAIAGANCVGDCPEPAPRTYSVYLPGLGQDQCPDRTSDDCEVRRRTLGARAVVDVHWERGGEGGRETWGLGAVSDESVVDESSDVPRFDTAALISTTLDPSGFTATGTVQLRWDREVDYQVIVHGSCFNEVFTTDLPPAITGTSRPHSAGVYTADIRLRGLCAGRPYWLEVRYSDDAGVTYVAGPPGEAGVRIDELWLGSYAVVPHLMLDVKMAIEVLKDERVEASFYVASATVEMNEQYFNTSFASRDTACEAGTMAAFPAVFEEIAQARTYTLQPSIVLASDWYYYPTSSTCRWPRGTYWRPEANSTITLEQLLNGVVVEGNLVPDLPASDTPFSYRVTIRGEYQD
jgi:hypothetical protein